MVSHFISASARNGVSLRRDVPTTRKTPHDGTATRSNSSECSKRVLLLKTGNVLKDDSEMDSC